MYHLAKVLNAVVLRQAILLNIIVKKINTLCPNQCVYIYVTYRMYKYYTVFIVHVGLWWRTIDAPRCAAWKDTQTPHMENHPADSSWLCTVLESSKWLVIHVREGSRLTLWILSFNKSSTTWLFTALFFENGCAGTTDTTVSYTDATTTAVGMQRGGFLQRHVTLTRQSHAQKWIHVHVQTFLAIARLHALWQCINVFSENSLIIILLVYF